MCSQLIRFEGIVCRFSLYAASAKRSADRNREELNRETTEIGGSIKLSFSQLVATLSFKAKLAADFFEEVHNWFVP